MVKTEFFEKEKKNVYGKILQARTSEEKLELTLVDYNSSKLKGIKFPTIKEISTKELVGQHVSFKKTFISSTIDNIFVSQETRKTLEFLTGPLQGTRYNSKETNSYKNK